MRALLVLVLALVVVGGVQAKETKETKRQEKAVMLGNRLCQVSQKRVEEMRAKQARIEKVLSEIERKMGKDAEVAAAIARAKLALEEAKSAISALSDKAANCQISASESKKLGEQVKETVRSRKSEVETAQAKLKASHEAVREAITTYAQNKER